MSAIYLYCVYRGPIQDLYDKKAKVIYAKEEGRVYARFFDYSGHNHYWKEYDIKDWWAVFYGV